MAIASPDSVVHDTTTHVMLAVTSSLVARPFLHLCDRWFRYCNVGYAERLLHGHADNDLLYAGAALHTVMDVASLRDAIEMWRAALEELRVMTMRATLRATREACLQSE
eukprot:6057940-Prymnesium_polylepis.1